MVILAIDSSAREGSLAVAIDDRVHTAITDASRSHGEQLPAAAMRLLEQQGLTLRDVDRFAVIAGPGSFTGLRVGIATVQGFALASGRDVVAIPTLDAIAESWRTAAPDVDVREPAIVVPCLDGQRGDVFFAAWLVDARTPVEDTTPLVDPQVGRPADLITACRTSGIEAGVLVGSGAVRYADVLAVTGLAQGGAIGPLADVCARMAMRRATGVSPHALRPFYIRRPDAVLARERAGLSRS